MFRPDREPRGEDPTLLLKMTLFFAAAAVAVTGMITSRPIVISIGILILFLAFLLRFIRPRQDDASQSDEPPGS